MPRRKNMFDDWSESLIYDFSLNEYLDFARLVTERSVILAKDITFETAVKICRQIEYLKAVGDKKKKEPIKLIVNNCGGDTDAGLLIYTTVLAARRDGFEVTAEVRGLAASAALDSILGVDKIIAWKTSWFLIHEIAYATDYMKSSEFKEKAEQIEKENRMLAQILADRCKKPIEEILALMKKKDYYLSSEEAKALGLVDEVIG